MNIRATGVVAAVMAAALAAQVPTAAAQEADPARWFAGGGLWVAQPIGEFGDYVDTGFGAGGHLLYAVDRAGVLGLRLDGGAVIYGQETMRVPLSPTIGGRVTVDVETTNSILMLGVGPQLMLPTGAVRPYLHGSAGVAYYTTDSSVEGTRSEVPFATSNNYDDLVFAYGGGAGVYIPVRRGAAPISIDLGVRYQHTGPTRYLREGSIEDLPGGGIRVTPVQSETDLVTFQLGISVALPRGDGRPEPGRGR